MMTLEQIYKGYTELMWSRLSALATWQPDVPLAVGDVVKAGKGGVVSRETSLSELKIPPGQLPYVVADAAPVCEHKGVTISASGSVGVAAAGKARASFSDEAAFLFVTTPGRQTTIRSMDRARSIIEGLHASKEWKPEWHLVTNVRSYPACTIVIARSSEAEAEVSVGLPAGGAAGVANIQAGAAVSLSSDHATQWVMSSNSTPLYQAMGVKRRLLRRQHEATEMTYHLRDADLAIGAEPEYQWVVRKSSPSDLGL